MKKYSEEEIRLKIISHNQKVDVLGTYAGYNEPIQVHCKNCGHIWSPLVSSLLHGHGCPSCAGKLKKSDEKFQTELSRINPDIECLGTYESAWKKIKFRCRKCDCEWLAAPRHILDGRSCPVCARIKRGGTQRLHKEILDAHIAEVDPEVIFSGDYSNNHTKIRLHCRRCGYDWEQTYHAYRCSTGCPNCHRHGTSFAEQFILESFRYVLGADKVLSRDKSLIGMELDIYIPSLGIAIEPGAWKFHRSSLKKSYEKEQACLENGVILITLFDHCDADSVDLKNYIIIKENLSNPVNFNKLKSITKELMMMSGIPTTSIPPEGYKEIKDNAYLKSRRISTLEFKQLAEDRNPKIEIVGEYKRSNIKIEYICKRCGRHLYAYPYSLLAGSGCMVCYGNPHKSDADFRIDMKRVNPTIEPLEEYVNTGHSMLFRCAVCGYEWKTQPYHLLAKNEKTGCPNCSGKARRTPESFVNKIHKSSPSLTMLGKYVSSKIPIELECNICGNRWMAIPRNIFKGSGCPKCSRQKVGQSKRKKVICLSTGVEYNSIKEAAAANGISASALCNAMSGKTQSAAGLRWSYLKANKELNNPEL